MTLSGLPRQLGAKAVFSRSAALLRRNPQLFGLLILLASVAGMSTYELHAPIWRLLYALHMAPPVLDYMPNPVWSALQAVVHLSLFSATICLAGALFDQRRLAGREFLRRSLAGVVPGLAYLLPPYALSLALAEIVGGALQAPWLVPVAALVGILLAIRLLVRIWPVLPVMMSERTRFVAALRRSRALIGGNRGRLLGVLVLLIAGCFAYSYLVMGAMAVANAVFAGVSPPQPFHSALNLAVWLCGGFLDLLATCYAGLVAAVVYDELRDR